MSTENSGGNNKQTLLPLAYSRHKPMPVVNKTPNLYSLTSTVRLRDVPPAPSLPTGRPSPPLPRLNPEAVSKIDTAAGAIKIREATSPNLGKLASVGKFAIESHAAPESGIRSLIQHDGAKMEQKTFAVLHAIRSLLEKQNTPLSQKPSAPAGVIQLSEQLRSYGV